MTTIRLRVLKIMGQILFDDNTFFENQPKSRMLICKAGQKLVQYLILAVKASLFENLQALRFLPLSYSYPASKSDTVICVFCHFPCRLFLKAVLPMSMKRYVNIQ